ncbi:MAG TPA: hypothetical protein VFP97_08280 [Chitinophagaceae bacterium]|nr:hypothetical protein [Chitinophagaceae bacterium]
MKTWVSLLTIIALVVTACGKDRFQTVPQLKLKSRNTDIVPLNGTLILNIEFTDKEGDVRDSLLVVRERLNVRGRIQLPASPYGIPDFPHTDKGEFELSLNYQFGLVFGLGPLRVPGSNPIRNEVDTLRLKIVARDAAGNKSDTLVVDNVYVSR